MVDIRALDEQISSLEPWITRAGKALRLFYNPALGVFWRDTFGIRNNDQKIHPTSTNRAFFALYDYLRFLGEEPNKDDSIGEVSATLQAVAERYLSRLPDEPEVVRQSGANGINMFTDSQLLVATSLLESMRRVVEMRVETARIRRAAEAVAQQNREALLQWNGGKVHPDDEVVHDFVTLHAVRAIDSFALCNGDQPSWAGQSLRGRVKEDVLRLLAFHFAGVSSKFDPAELTFSVALLNRFPTPDAAQLTARSVRSIVESQAGDGAWPTARFISYEGRGLLHVASYEVALTLTDILLRKLREDDVSFCDVVLPALGQTFELVKSYYAVEDGIAGWANDHTRRSGLIESWATAIVLMFLIHYRDALFDLRQYLILKQYSPVHSRGPERARPWPDMVPILRQAEWVDLDSIDAISDPTDNASLVDALKREVIEPVASDWIHRPKAASLILYGPPGTRKTTLVRQVAQALHWPLVIVSPPEFLCKGGLEGFEAAAAEIFDHLLRLRRVVVLFDECEEFFKPRPSKQQLESRTIGAFITAGMLPRLQTLRDNRWVIFVLATNSGLDELDTGVTRLGRFDYAQEISYPTLKAQIRYLRRKAASLPGVLDVLQAAVEESGSRTGNDQTVQAVSFSMLDRLVELIMDTKVEPAGQVVTDLVQSALRRRGLRPLI